MCKGHSVQQQFSRANFCNCFERYLYSNESSSILKHFLRRKKKILPLDVFLWNKNTLNQILVEDQTEQIRKIFERDEICFQPNVILPFLETYFIAALISSFLLPF